MIYIKTHQLEKKKQKQKQNYKKLECYFYQLQLCLLLGKKTRQKEHIMKSSSSQSQVVGLVSAHSEMQSNQPKTQYP